jgi:UDPglucose 6-dehydrogenase
MVHCRWQTPEETSVRSETPALRPLWSEAEVSERISVCGLGKVGLPILNMLREKGYRTIGYDRDWKRSEASIEDAVNGSDACIFIVQTPSNEDGSFSNDHLIEALTKFHDVAPADYLYIITSTTTPGSCDRFRAIVGDNVVYKPEFIRLEFVDADLRAPSFVLIGEHRKEAGDRAEAIYRGISDAPVKRMSLLEAELAKITLNCALTMKISLANQLYLVARKLGADPGKIMDAVGEDPRINRHYLTPGWPYSGPCLPRDNRMFQYVAEQVGVCAALSIAADQINADIYHEQN